MTKEEPETHTRVNKKEYFTRLSPVDRNNLQTINRLFIDVMNKQKRSGKLFIVGGSIIKPLPRKDIDIVIVFDPTTNNFSDKMTPYRQALESFTFFRQIIEGIVNTDSSFRIINKIEPAIDEEFQSESILKHNGSITLVNNKGGTPIEFIRIGEEKIDDFVRKINGPYVEI